MNNNNNTTASQWPQPELASLPEDDFEGFLDFDFSLIDPINQANTSLGLQDVNIDMPDAPSFFDTNPFGDDATAQMQQLPQQQLFEQADATPTTFGFDPSQTFALQQHIPDFSNPSTHGYYPQGPVPPTPNSTNLNPEAYQYVQHMDPQSSHRWAPYQLRKDDAMAIHTPMVSPEVQPHENSFPYLHDFTLANQYGLSPLTSPAIHPQHNLQRTPLIQSHTTDSSLAASPIDLNFAFPSEQPSSASSERPRRTKRKTQAARPGSRGRGSSVATSGQRRGSLSVLVPGPDTLPAASEGLPTSAPPARSIRSRRQSLSDNVDYSSSSKSLSPQPSMAPPPRPGSSNATSWPTLKPRPPRELQPSVSNTPAATPTSMMRLQQVPNSGVPLYASPAMSPNVQASPAFGPSLRSTLEDLHLPDSAVPHTESGQATPRPGKATATRRKLATPLMSATSSPSFGPAYSPSMAANTPKLDANGARNTRKRFSAASSLVSPALRPRISPSIKPLLPEGANLSSASEAHALLLASKSNYQNIIEGNHLPGVSYPTELTTNLSSKRTSHKLAEQGRRNRINTALQELQTLLPPASPVVAAADSKDDGTPAASSSALDSPTSPATAAAAADDLAQHKDQPSGSRTPALTAQQSNSKAATVELAIEHIRLLKKMLEDQDKVNEALRTQVESLTQALNGGVAGCEAANDGKSGAEVRPRREKADEDGRMDLDAEGETGAGRAGGEGVEKGSVDVDVDVDVRGSPEMPEPLAAPVAMADGTKA